MLTWGKSLAKTGCKEIEEWWSNRPLDRRSVNESPIGIVLDKNAVTPTLSQKSNLSWGDAPSFTCTNIITIQFNKCEKLWDHKDLMQYQISN